MADYREAFVGIDVAKLKNGIAVAESGRNGEVTRDYLQRLGDVLAQFCQLKTGRTSRPSSRRRIAMRVGR